MKRAAALGLPVDCPVALGAPLSFLDHHLRCGNSLVGATFADLEQLTGATKQRAAAMFGVD